MENRIEELLQLMEAINQDELLWIEQELEAINELEIATQQRSI